MNWLQRLFGAKEGKEKLKEKHGNKFNDCNFGIKEFNKNKRSRGFIEEIRLAEKKRGKPPKPTQPPPQPPPPTTTATGVVLLVFNGGVVSGTSWNYAGDITLDHSGLTLEEQDNVLRAVQADFSQFNLSGERIRITSDQAVYDAAPSTRRSKVFITESWEWFGQSGGVSFVDSFGNPSQNVCFVFSGLLGYIQKYIMEATSHEIGHQMGCHHQSTYDANCVKISEYNYGNAQEAPIMGVAYNAVEGRWIVGPNSYGCNSIQDDAAIIRAKLG